MRSFVLALFAVVAAASPSPVEAGGHGGTRVRIKSGGPGKGNADRTRIDVRSGHDRTKVDVRGDRVRVDVREHGRHSRHDRHHDVRIRAWHGMRARWGHRFVLSPPVVFELRVHARRIAWLRRIRFVAVDVGDVATVSRVDGLLLRETSRHDVRVSGFFSVH